MNAEGAHGAHRCGNTWFFRAALRSRHFLSCFGPFTFWATLLTAAGTTGVLSWTRIRPHLSIFSIHRINRIRSVFFPLACVTPTYFSPLLNKDHSCGIWGAAATLPEGGHSQLEVFRMEFWVFLFCYKGAFRDIRRSEALRRSRWAHLGTCHCDAVDVTSNNSFTTVESCKAQWKVGTSGERHLETHWW